MRKTRVKELKKIAIALGVNTKTEFRKLQQGESRPALTVIAKTNGLRAMKKAYLRGVS